MKLNRKGFTLIELLAVVVILAVILVVTIPSVLETMTTARQKSFEDAVDIMRDYAQKQYDVCVISVGLTNVEYNKNLFDANSCTFKTSGTDLITGAGYETSDFASAIASMDETNKDKVIVTATPNTAGTFKDYSREITKNDGTKETTTSYVAE